jgi:hypothetical protein
LIDHQNGDGLDLSLFRNGEWLTRERAGYDVPTSDQKNTLAIQNGDGYLRRDRDPTDARAKIVSITSKGAALLAEVERIYAEIEGDWGRHIGERRVASMRSALTDGLTAFFGDQSPPVHPTW